MSVFTSVNITQLSQWLADYAVGDVVDIKGISSGITNTNYFVTTHVPETQSFDQAQATVGLNRYVLTLFEHNALEELPYFVDLMTHLAKHQVPCPKPITDIYGKSLHMLNGKPAIMVSCLTGRDVEMPTVTQCAAIGEVLAKMHLAGLSFDDAQDNHNSRGQAWRVETAEKVLPHLSVEDQQLLNETLAFQADLDLSNLPRGVIHADLFRDNVLFDGDQIGGLIDFYYACHDVLAYDIAIAVNDWCVEDNGEFDEVRLTALLSAYQAIRPFSDEEQANWESLLRIAALRFWLSRLYDKAYPQAGEMTHAKDPDHFKRILILRSH